MEVKEVLTLMMGTGSLLIALITLIVTIIAATNHNKKK
ncbi:putative holin-like toxin [Paenibacillus sp. GCM10027626]